MFVRLLLRELMQLIRSGRLRVLLPSLQQLHIIGLFQMLLMHISFHILMEQVKTIQQLQFILMQDLHQVIYQLNLRGIVVKVLSRI